MLYLSFRKVFKSFLRLIVEEINNNTIPIDKAEGKRNNPLQKNISLLIFGFLKLK